MVARNERPFETRYTRQKDETDELNGRLPSVYKIESQLWPPNYGGQRRRQRQSVSHRSKTRRYRAPNPYGLDDIEGKLRKVYFGDPICPDVVNTVYHTVVNDGRAIDSLSSNKALSDFVNKVRDGNAASAAVTLAEWRQSEKMIVARAGQLVQGLRAVRRGDVGKLNKLFKPPPGFKPKAKSGANLWLEYHFGWSPLINDIHSAVKVLSSVPPSFKIRGRGRSREPFTVKTGNSTTYIQADVNYICATECGGEVFVSNPNLALANQMGFINPLTVAWELVPFSFLVDWFLPVGDFLNSFTDLLGYTVHYPYTTRKRTANGLYRYADGRFITDVDISAVNLSRVLSLPTYKLRTTPFKGLSLSRGATAISLVIQQFLSIGKR